MTTETPLKPRAIRLHADRSDLVPGAARRVPDDVATANALALEAIEAQEIADAERGAAIEAVAQAPQRDAAADQAALAAGAKEMPTRSEPQRRQELAEANRKAEAAEAVARQRMRELSVSIAEAWPGWIEDQRESVAEAKAEIDRHLDSLRVAFGHFHVESELADGLLRFAGEKGPAFTGFGRPHADRAEAKRLARADAEERTHFELRRNGHVPRELPSLLAALRLLAEES